MTWHPDMPPEYRNQIVTGDARELAKRIPDESVDLIFADPVYDRIDDYRWLAETAARVLKPGGNMIVQSAHYYLPNIFAAINGQLDYVWTIAEKLSGGQASIFKHRLTVAWKPYLWYSRGPRNGRWVLDWFEGGGISKAIHKWGDSPNMFSALVERLTDFSSIIFDPFTGGGTVPAVCKMLQRNYIAFEIDPATADLARERVANTQPPLPLVMPEQGVLL